MYVIIIARSIWANGPELYSYFIGIFDREHPSARKQLMPKKKTFPFTNEVTILTGGVSAKVTKKKRGICSLWCGVDGDQLVTPGKRRK